MTSERDLDHVLHRMVSDDAADRLLAGDATASDTEGMADLASLLKAARGPAGSDELAGEWATVTAFTTAVKAVTQSTPTQGSKPVKVRRMTGKAAAIVAAATCMSVGSGAAETGTLPDAVQRTVPSAISHVGIDLPKPDVKPDDKGTEKGTDTKPETGDDNGKGAGVSGAKRSTTTTVPGADVSDPKNNGVGPDANGPAKDGLCRAFGDDVARGKSDDSVAARNLKAAADAAKMTVAQFCAGTAPGSSATSSSLDDKGRESERPETTNKENEARSTSTSVKVEGKSTGDTRPSVPTVTTKNEAPRASDAPKPTSTTKAENRGGNSNNSNNSNGTGGTGRG